MPGTPIMCSWRSSCPADSISSNLLWLAIRRSWVIVLTVSEHVSVPLKMASTPVSQISVSLLANEAEKRAAIERVLFFFQTGQKSAAAAAGAGAGAAAGLKVSREKAPLPTRKALPTTFRTSWAMVAASLGPPVVHHASLPITRRQPLHCRGRSHHTVNVSSTSPPSSSQVDVCVVGSGIIGLSVSLSLLRTDPSIRVALIERAGLCAGATGAGQGYIWLAHRDPSSPMWQLATHSRALWREWLDEGTVGPLTDATVEWQRTGSMLLAGTAEESAALAARAAMLEAAGVRAECMSASEARRLEPALAPSAAGEQGEGGSALLVPGDSQLNGRSAAAALLAACAAHGARFQPRWNEAAGGLVRAGGAGGRVAGVRSASGAAIHAGLGVVVAAGAWTAPFLAAQLGEGSGWGEAIKPRRGHLLEVARPDGMPEVQRGLMECGYTKVGVYVCVRVCVSV